MAPEEEPMVKEIERALQKSLPRITLPHFNYKQPAVGRGARGRSREPHRLGRHFRRR
jgi:hypothetical protein